MTYGELFSICEKNCWLDREVYLCKSIPSGNANKVSFSKAACIAEMVEAKKVIISSNSNNESNNGLPLDDYGFPTSSRYGETTKYGVEYTPHTCIVC